MNLQDVIRMASEVGMRPNMTEALISELVHFAALVAAAEREAIVQMIESDDSMRWAGAAEAIRARGNK